LTTRSLTLVLCLASAAALLLLRQTATQAQITNPQPAPGADELQAVTLVLGAKDNAPAKWDGAASIAGGKIENIAGYHFTSACKILNGNAWECATHPWAPFAAGMHPNEKPQPQPTIVETVGVTIQFRAPAGAELRVKVPKGEFSFRPMDIPEAEGIFPLGATVEVYRTPPVEKVTAADFENDYPALAADGNSLWLSWQGYKNESDQVFLRNYSAGRWGERLTVTDKLPTEKPPWCGLSAMAKTGA
jgi:hypothetical protein